MLKKEYELIIPFVKEPWKRFTFKEIKKLSKKKSESYVYNGLKKFVKQEILKEERVGNVLQYSLNLNLKSQIYVGFVSEYVGWSKKHIPYKDIENIAEKIPTIFYILIITGSYAKNTQNKKSDIDIILIVDDTVDTKRIYAELRQACELNIPEIHLYVFKKSEFYEMLMNKEANYGKEIVRNNLLLYGGQEYYKIMQEAIKNGFGNKNLYW